MSAKDDDLSHLRKVLRSVPNCKRGDFFHVWARKGWTKKTMKRVVGTEYPRDFREFIDATPSRNPVVTAFRDMWGLRSKAPKDIFFGAPENWPDMLHQAKHLGFSPDTSKGKDDVSRTWALFILVSRLTTMERVALRHEVRTWTPEPHERSAGVAPQRTGPDPHAVDLWSEVGARLLNLPSLVVDRRRVVRNQVGITEFMHEVLEMPSYQPRGADAVTARAALDAIPGWSYRGKQRHRGTICVVYRRDGTDGKPSPIVPTRRRNILGEAAPEQPKTERRRIM